MDAPQFGPEQSKALDQLADLYGRTVELAGRGQADSELQKQYKEALDDYAQKYCRMEYLMSGPGEGQRAAQREVMVHVHRRLA